MEKKNDRDESSSLDCRSLIKNQIKNFALILILGEISKTILLAYRVTHEKGKIDINESERQ